MKILAKHHFNCPHCDSEQEEVAENYPIQGHVGNRSRTEEECWDCAGTFLMENNGDGTCELIKG